MSTEYRRTRNKYGEPVLHIKVTGAHDIFRVSWNALHDQCEFAEAGAASMRWLRRVLGTSRFTSLDKSLTGGEAQRYSRQLRGDHR